MVTVPNGIFPLEIFQHPGVNPFISNENAVKGNITLQKWTPSSVPKDPIKITDRWPQTGVFQRLEPRNTVIYLPSLRGALYPRVNTDSVSLSTGQSAG
jgi:hypothetical protein